MEHKHLNTFLCINLFVELLWLLFVLHMSHSCFFFFPHCLSKSALTNRTQKPFNDIFPGSDPHRQSPRRPKRRPSWSFLALKTERTRKVKRVLKVAWPAKVATRSNTLALMTWVKVTVTTRALTPKRRRRKRQRQLWRLWAPVWTALTQVTLRTARPAATQVRWSFNLWSPQSSQYISFILDICHFPPSAIGGNVSQGRGDEKAPNI